jgi:hypothetical protein
MNIQDLTINGVYDKTSILDTFSINGDLYGVGISPKTNSVVAVYALNSSYNNRWEDGILKYIRNIQGNDYLHEQNKALMDAPAWPLTIHVFEKSFGKYTYKGIFISKGDPVIEKDQFNNSETYCFSLEPASKEVIPTASKSPQIDNTDDKMKLLRVYKTDRDLVISTSKGERYCRLSNAKFLNIDELERKCDQLIGSNVITTAKWGYGDDYFFGEIEEDTEVNISSNLPNENSTTRPQETPKSNQKPFSDDERFVKRIIGPPGTGKTYTLMELISTRLKEGLKPSEIAFVSFSNEAANVAKNRIDESDDFPGYNKRDFTYFRTLHSLSVGLGCSGGKKFMDSKHMKNFDGTIETKEVWREKGIAETVVWRDEHFCLTLKSLANSRKLSIDEVFDDVREIETETSNLKQVERSFEFNKWHITTHDYLGLAKEWLRLYEDYKTKNNLMDFDDMIAAMTNPNFDKSKMRFKLFIVDEAQDNSDALWDFAKLVISESKECIVAGDDNQAIMEQFGASPKAFLDLDVDEEEELNISYRLPISGKEALDKGSGAKLAPRVFEVCSEAEKGSIIGSIISMIDGKKETSELDLHTLTEIVQDLSINGDWLIMAPTNDSVKHISEIFQKYEIPHFRKNEPITLKNEKKVSRNIRVQTIHTSKGAEAENVAIVLRTRGDGHMYYKNGIHSDRLAYVAESRHKNRLYRIGLKPLAESLLTAIDDRKQV